MTETIETIETIETVCNILKRDAKALSNIRSECFYHTVIVQDGKKQTVEINLIDIILCLISGACKCEKKSSSIST